MAYGSEVWFLKKKDITRISRADKIMIRRDVQCKLKGWQIIRRIKGQTGNSRHH